MTALRVLYETKAIIAFDKPAGVLVIPGRGESEGSSLREQIESALQRPVFVVHRLDRDTTGVVLFALDSASHRTLSMAFEAGGMEKTYWALCANSLTEPLEVSVPLMAARRGRMRPARPSEQGKDARTKLRPLERFDHATWVEATPVTGRTHQIRVHLQWAGHPLLVDHQYGRAEPLRARDLGGTSDAVVLARTPLHAAALRLPALEKLAPALIEAPMPPDMAEALALLRAGLKA